MNYPILMGTEVPAYLQLYRHLVRDITDGIYPYGSRLPSKRILAADTGLSVITVEHAVSLLCEEGYADSRQRSGCFVTYRSKDFSGTPNLGAYDAPSGTHPMHTDDEFPFSVLARTMRRVISEYGDRLLVKSPNRGCPELQREICSYLARSRGLHMEPEGVVIGAGAEYLYGLVAQLLGTDITAAIENPGYAKIRLVYEALGITCERLPLGREGILTEALQNSRADFLHVTPFNSFPSGISADASKKWEYLRWSEERKAYLVEDNYESELTVSQKAEDSLFALSGGERVIYINSFSKTIAPSIRIAYMLLPQELSRTFEDRLGFYSCTAPVFEQYLLAELLKTGDFERHVNRVRRNRRRNR